MYRIRRWRGAAPIWLLAFSFAPGPPRACADTLLDTVDSLLVEGLGDSALLILDPAVDAARDAGDERLEITLLVRKGTALKYAEGAAAAERFLEEVVGRARGHEDCSLLTAALYHLAQAMDEQGRPPRAVPVYEELAERARACDEPLWEGRALTFIARHDLRAGVFEDAREHVERAGDIFREAGLDDELHMSRFLHGVVLVRVGHLREARAAWEESAAWARRNGRNWSVLGSSLNNLGRLEMSVGDPGRAVAYWQEARELLVAKGRVRSAITPAKNAALALTELGRYDDAFAILDAQRKIADERGYVDHELALRVDLAIVESASGRWNESLARVRELLPLLDTESSPELRARALVVASDAAAKLEGAEESIRWLRVEAEPLRPRIDAQMALQLDRRLGAGLGRAGHITAAESLLARCLADADQEGWKLESLAVVPDLARSRRALGRTAECLETLRRGADVWESERGVPEDPEWREQRGSLGARIFSELVGELLSGSQATPGVGRKREAFEILQRYKTRTLVERMAGPDLAPGDTLPPFRGVSLEDLRGVLRPGEIWLDILAGPDRSVLFVVSADALDVRALPPSAEVGAGLAQYRELLRTAPDSDAGRASARWVADVALAGGLDAVTSADRVIFAPDGPWHLLPLAALPDPEGSGPMVANREIVHIPSAAVLVRARAGHAPCGTPIRLLALAGARAAGGRPLNGARDEVRRLNRLYRGVETRPEDDRTPAESLEAWDALHIAGHTELDDARPWRSGFVLSEGAGETQWLRAADVARARLTARLAVLSGCDTAGGRVVSGEGVIGLTGAFLAAGVPVVVSSTWPVGDRATAFLMDAFYDRLADGETVAAALRGAQRTRAAAGAPPAQWAGFLVVGDGDARVPMERRRRIPGGGLLVLGAGAMRAAAISRRRVAGSTRTIVP